MSDAVGNRLTAGWLSSFPVFASSDSKAVRDALHRFVEDASESQLRAWRDAVPALQAEVSEVQAADSRSENYSAVLEYRLPLEQRRSDALFLVGGPILVLELKGKASPSQADLDQAHGYARDLRAYHRECQDRPVHAVLVPMRWTAPPELLDEVWICSPGDLHQLVSELSALAPGPAVRGEDFLSPDAYRPLPTIVQAARELFFSREVREVWRARAVTTPTVDYIAAVAHEAASSKSRHLILITGVPGAGKTLVGMRAVHAPYLDDLAVPRLDGKPTVPALFLSGNGPLVEILQYALKKSGGGGRTFIRHIKDYLDAYAPRPERIPPEHLLVFDEAQRAFTPDMVTKLHTLWPTGTAKSEPRLFVDICSRMPEWSVLVGLIGSGQEIHLGEEGGLAQWRDALLTTPGASEWTLHAPPELQSAVGHEGLKSRWTRALNLDTEIRFHVAQDLHALVSELLEPGASLAESLTAAEGPRNASLWRLDGIKLYVTRNLDFAKAYLRERYGDQTDARYGILASSRDRDLMRFGVDNTFQTTKNVRRGPWYVGGDEDPDSCRHLRTCMTEFGAQGLELDMALVAWGTDLRRAGGAWDNSLARKYRAGSVA